MVVTGASSGLGAGLARSYAAPGRVLALIGRNVARLEAVAAACRAAGAQVVTGILDVADGAAIQAWLGSFDTAHPVDLVVANAGISSGTRPNGDPEGIAAATAVVRTNLLGVMHTVEVLLPRMLARGVGHVAVVASVAAYRGLPDSPAYCASKAGVRDLWRVVASGAGAAGHRGQRNRARFLRQPDVTALPRSEAVPAGARRRRWRAPARGWTGGRRASSCRDAWACCYRPRT